MAKLKEIIYKDFFWYALGMAIPMFINLIKTPIFTRHYSTEAYGYLGLVMMVFMYFSTVTYSWLSSCIWRFYHIFEQKKMTYKLYANIFFLYLISTLVTLFGTLVFIVFFHQPYLVLELILLCFFHFIIKELLALFNVILRVKGNAKLSNLLVIAQVLSAFALVYLFAFGFGIDISALISSSIIIDVLILLVLVYYYSKKQKLSWLKFSLVHRRYLKIFLHFGSFILLSSLVTLLIVSSDRYVLALYDTIENVGIYTKVYDIAQISITAFVFVFFSVINPKMNKELAVDTDGADDILSQYVYAYLLILFPITFLISLFSKEIATLLLGDSFRAGYIIMPYVFFSAFIYGLITFNLNKLKFKNKLQAILIVLSVCFAINLILNFIFVPTYGYFAAAVTTLVSYFTMCILFFRLDSFGLLQQINKLKTLVKQLFILIGFYFLTQWLRSVYTFNVISAIGLGLVYVAVFFVSFYKTYKQLKLPV